MMKHYKQGGLVRAFDEVDVEEFVTDDMIEMTFAEYDPIINPQKYLSDEEKRAQYLASLKPLTRRQFKLVLLENNLLDRIENAVSAIADDKTRARIQIEYTEATEFHRVSESIAYMCALLELTEAQVDAMWEQALTL